MNKQKLFHRNFLLLILGQVSSLLGNFTLKFALSMYVLEQTGSAAVFAGILAMALLPTILLSPFGGILADRANRRNIMVALDSLSGIAVLGAGVALSGGYDIIVIGALLIVLSVLGAFESPTVQACVPQMLSGENLLRGNAVVNQVAAVASLITPFAGSFFYAALGIKTVLYATVICFFVTAIIECFIRLDAPDNVSHRRIGEVVKEDFSVSMGFLRKEEPEILKMLLLAALVSLFVAGTAVVGFPYLVRNVLGFSVEYYGAAESAMGIAAILGSVFVGIAGRKMRLGILAIVIMAFGGSLIFAGLVFVLPVGDLGKYIFLLTLFCVCQFGCSIFSTYAISIIQERTPDHLMGKIMAYVFTLSLCAQPVGQIIYGALFGLFHDNPCWVLAPSGLIVCLTGIVSAGIFDGMNLGKEE